MTQTKHSGPIRWTQGGREYTLVREFELSGMLDEQHPATPADLIAALMANPEVRAEVAVKLGLDEFGLKCAECGAEWMNDAGLDMCENLRAAEARIAEYKASEAHWRESLAETNEALILASTTTEKEVRKQLEAAQSRMRELEVSLETIREDRRVQRVAKADAEIALSECQSRVRELEAAVRRGKMMAGWFLLDRCNESLVRRFPVIAQAARDLESFDFPTEARDQKRAAGVGEPAKQDSSPAGGSTRKGECVTPIRDALPVAFPGDGSGGADAPSTPAGTGPNDPAPVAEPTERAWEPAPQLSDRATLRRQSNIMSNQQFESDKRHAILSGMTDNAAAEYADRLQQHPSRGGDVLSALDRASHVGALAAWASSHELGAVHLQHRRNMSTTESLFQVVLTARDSLDLESGWFTTADEAWAVMVGLLKPEPAAGGE